MPKKVSCLNLGNSKNLGKQVLRTTSSGKVDKLTDSIKGSFIGYEINKKHGRDRTGDWEKMGFGTIERAKCIFGAGGFASPVTISEKGIMK